MQHDLTAGTGDQSYGCTKIFNVRQKGGPPVSNSGLRRLRGGSVRAAGVNRRCGDIQESTRNGRIQG